MNRYRSYGERDDQPQVVGDGAFKGVDEYNAIENIAEGEVQQAVNMDFTSQDAVTRGGFVCLPAVSRLSNPLTRKMLQNVESTIPIAQFTRAVLRKNDQYLFITSAATSSGTNPVVTTYTSYVYETYDFNTFTLVATINNTNVFSGCFSYGKFFIVGFTGQQATGYPPTTPYAASSSDGITWASISNIPAGPTALNLILPAFNTLVIAANSSTKDYVIKSTDQGVNWTSAEISYSIQSLQYFDGVFVASYWNTRSFPFSQSAVYSYDALAWYQSNLPIASSSDPKLLQISSGNSMLLCTHFNESVIKIYRSLDGINWSNTINTYSFREVVGLTFYNGQFIAIFGNGLDPMSGDTICEIASTISGEALVSRYLYPPIESTTLYDSTYLQEYYNFTDKLLFNDRTFVGYVNIGGAQSKKYESRFFQLLDSTSVYASTVYTDPDEPGDQWVAIVGSDSVGFYASGRSTRRVSFNGQYVTEQSTIVQCNNLVYIFRGPNDTPLYWNGDWSSKFELAPTPTPASGFQTIPNSNQATYYQNRLWVKKGKDEILASDILDFNTYETITNSFNLNTGSSDYIVATFPFGDKTLLVFKNKSVLALNNVEGSLADVTATEVTRQVGLVGIRAITSVGPDLAYVSYKNVNLITLTATNNSVQHKTLPLSFKIKKIMDRVNWEYAYKISLGYADNKLYVALPLDNSIFCNAVAVYNFVTGQWYGEWNFDGAMNMCIQDFQVANYLGLQKIHAVTEDGRIFVAETGNTDINSTYANNTSYVSPKVYANSSVEISTKLVTRAYDTSGLNHYQRRMFMDLATLRPSFSVVAYTEGASESSTLITNQTYSRAESWKFNDSTYDLTNANNDYNRAYRKDYSTGATSIQPQSGFEPEMLQEFRLPLMTTRQGRLSWLEITNTQGTINIMSAGFETRPGQRSNLVQV